MKPNDDHSDPILGILNSTKRERIAIRREDEMKFDNLLSGTTATLVIQVKEKAYIGRIGDSMVTVGGNSTTDNKGKNVDEIIHRPEQPKEKYRIYDHRGEVRETDDGKHRLFLRARMYPGLTVSRTIGDLISH